MNSSLTTPAEPVSKARDRGSDTLKHRWRAAWAGLRAAIGALLGLAPHVMHHIGLFVGAALLTGALGNSVLYAAGLLLSIPLLTRLQRRYDTWRAPILGVAVFTVLFGISTFVIGPLVNPSGTQQPQPPAAVDEHAEHHP